MFKTVAILLMVVVCALAKASPGLIAPIAYSSPVLAHSSQVIARNYNGLAYATHPLAYTAAPIVKTIASPLAYTAPLGLASSAYTHNYVARAVSPYAYASHLGYASPYSYGGYPATYAAGHLY